MSEEHINPWLRRLQDALATPHDPAADAVLGWSVLPGGEARRCRCGYEVLRCTRYQRWLHNGDLRLVYPSRVFRASPDSPLIDVCPGCGEILELSVGL